MSNIQAGTGASNVIPGELRMVFNLRFNPHWTAAKLEAEIETLFERHHLDFSVSWHRSGEPFFTPEGRLRSTARRSEEHTSELQSLMRISYAVFCLKKKNTHNNIKYTEDQY